MTWRGRRLMTRIVALGRYEKRTLLVVNDLVVLGIALWLSLSVRYGRPFVPTNWAFTGVLVLAPVLAVLTFFQLGLYKLVTRFVGGRSINRIGFAVGLSVTAWALILFLSGIQGVPRLSLVAYWASGTIGVWGTRQIAGWLLKAAGIAIAPNVLEQRRRVLIFGAGTTGVQLAVGLVQSERYEMMGFVDPSANLRGQYVASYKVRQPDNIESLIATWRIDDVFLALPEMDRGERVKLLRRLEATDVNVRIVPDLADIASGRVLVSDLRPVDAMDLLGRTAVVPQPELLGSTIDGRAVMITGAGGSIGSELVRQIVKLGPRCLVLFDAAEGALYEIEAEVRRGLAHVPGSIKVVSVLGSVRDEALVERVLAETGVETLFHAAAFKHVPIVEQNVIAGFDNNTFGTDVLARAAAKCGVQRFVLISTDKAVRPTSMMGASKRLAEMVLQAHAAAGQSKTIFTMVRFGNVLDSSGSVIRLFRRQIETGGPVTVTHKDMIRYFMSIPEAASLVIQAGALAKGGEVFVLDMGEPIKIDDMARSMIRLSGRTVRDAQNPSGDVEIVYVGLRPGEKLREELLIDNIVTGTEHPRILNCQEPFLALPELDRLLAQLREAMERCNEADIRALVARTIDGVVDSSAGDTATEAGGNTQPLVSRSIH
jgi:FlaA1/EpsC-like NDP-sugar epimerase